MTKIEEVARAMERADGHDPDEMVLTRDDGFIARWQGALPAARAAIEAVAQLIDELVEERKAQRRNHNNETIASVAGWLRQIALSEGDAK